MNPTIQAILNETQKVILGKQAVIETLLASILAGGHVLLDDVPGVGKTTLAVALSRALGLAYRRVQFTPDVLPSDITGFSIFNKQTNTFEYRPGVVTEANLLLGDEINRTSSKTQSALLEAMEENQVTVDGVTHPLLNPFAVIATQNNVGTAGTQLLPYAQLDRFLVRVSIGYPDHESQIALMRDRQAANPIDAVQQVTNAADVLRMKEEVRGMTMKDSVLDYVARLCAATREHPMAELGVSPRGALSLCRMASARAYVQNRDFTAPDDVQAVFEQVCAHRLLLNQKAKMKQVTAAGLLAEVAAAVKVPDVRGR